MRYPRAREARAWKEYTVQSRVDINSEYAQEVPRKTGTPMALGHDVMPEVTRRPRCGLAPQSGQSPIPGIIVLRTGGGIAHPALGT
jgi:hypothetical protein